MIRLPLTLVLAALVALTVRWFLPQTRRRSVAATVGSGVVAGALGAVALGTVFDRGAGIEDAVVLYGAASGALVTWLVGLRDPQPRRR